jgi:hypothetical protein
MLIKEKGTGSSTDEILQPLLVVTKLDHQQKTNIRGK